jgi:hypothetical protein
MSSWNKIMQVLMVIQQVTNDYATWNKQVQVIM